MKKFELGSLTFLIFTLFLFSTSTTFAYDKKGVSRSAIVCTGQTTPGDTDWVLYKSGKGIYVEVDTSSCGFNYMPLYITSLGGNSGHWSTTGATSIYSATKNKFRIYLRWAKGSYLDPAMANERGWHINWIAIKPDISL